MIPWSGRVWRILFADRSDTPLAPAGAPEGRFHHGGQIAIYCSLTPEGAAAAMRRYLRPDDPPRVIRPLAVEAQRILDLSRSGPGTPVASVWQDRRRDGERPATRDISDRARADGAQGMLYPSRTRPDLLHLLLFTADVLRTDGPPQPWLDPFRDPPQIRA